jgi:GntR family transcriptional regulator, phosphonate transport system regulatory protein
MTPVYVQIAERLRRDISQGIYQVGDRLPTELQLSEQFGVNRHTLRQAIALLKRDGLLRVEQGRGTFVADQSIRYPIGKRVRYNELLSAQGRKAGFHFLRTEPVEADIDLADQLNITVGDSVLLIERIGLDHEQPVSVSTSYLPVVCFPNLLDSDILDRLRQLSSISKFLQQVYECDHLRRRTSVSARFVEPRDARFLNLPLNHPILWVESININQHGTVIEYGVTRFRSDRVELVFENNLLEL